MKIVLMFLSVVLINCAHAHNLQQKLDKQWELYEQTRQALLTQVQKTSLPPAQRAISRADWEKMVNPTGEWAFEAKDIEELKKWQQARIDQAYQKALKDSVIDLNQVRQKKQAAQFCADFPKGGMLHVHDSGTLDRQTVHDLVSSRNPSLQIDKLLAKFNDPNSGSILYDNEKVWLNDHINVPYYLSLSPVDQKQFEEYFFLPPGNHPFPRFEAVFSFISLVSRDYAAYEKILLDFAKRSAKQKLIYVELREAVHPIFAPLLKKIEKDYGVTIRVNRAYFRVASIEKLDQQTQELLAEAQQPWVVGIDFLANEDGNSALDKGQLLYGSVLHANLTGKSKLRRTMHSGEIGDKRNPRDAIIMGAERLGHAVLLIEDPVTLEYAALKRIPVEINLSSNLRLTHIKSMKNHPFLHYLRLGIPISLSTDDEGIFDSSINMDCELAITESNITYAELRQMSVNSIETSFASDADKKMLLTKLNKSLGKFEKSWR